MLTVQRRRALPLGTTSVPPTRASRWPCAPRAPASPPRGHLLDPLPWGGWAPPDTWPQRPLHLLRESSAQGAGEGRQLTAQGIGSSSQGRCGVRYDPHRGSRYGLCSASFCEEILLGSPSCLTLCPKGQSWK